MKRNLMLCALCAWPVLADDPNPRNARFDGPVIEYVSIEPRVEVHRIGDGPGLPDAERLTLTAFIRVPRGASGELAIDWGTGEAEAIEDQVPPEQSVPIRREMARGDVRIDGAVRLFGPASGQERMLLDTCELGGERAMRVALLVERGTLDAGNERFGSFVRRMRKSLDDLRGFLNDPDASTEPERFVPMLDRFRIDYVEEVERGDGRPELFDEHPWTDVVILCDEGGPTCCFWLPAYSIGHNFKWNDQGLWSTSGEQALWHELLHFRGVPDYYIYNIPAGSLPGRTSEAIGLPEPWGSDIMCSTYIYPPRFSSLTQKVLNAKHGVSRVGACEETDHEYGHMWRWIPRTLRVHLTAGGTDAPGVRFAWYRGRSAGLADGRVQGVKSDAEAGGTAVTDAGGIVEIAGDYMGVHRPRADRSLWLLVEAERDTGGRTERRFGIIYGLWLNDRWAEGDRAEATIELKWEDMRAVPTDVPEDAQRRR